MPRPSLRPSPQPGEIVFVRFCGDDQFKVVCGLSQSELISMGFTAKKAVFPHFRVENVYSSASLVVSQLQISRQRIAAMKTVEDGNRRQLSLI